MEELYRRFAGHPWITAELLLASLIANVLALASSLFVIQVLNRYVAYGVGATLATLTVGVIAAVLLEVLFRHARLLLAAGMIGENDENRAVGAFGIMLTAKWSALSKMPAGLRRETLRGLDTVETVYNANNITAVLDVPFALLLVLALVLLSPPLGAIAAVFIVAVFAFSIVSQRLMRRPMQRLTEVSSIGNTLAAAADQAADTVRAFNGHDQMMNAWRKYVSVVQGLRRKIGAGQGMTQTVSYTAQALMGVAIIAVGAVLVTLGHLDVGTMIGCNILASRALGPITKFAQLNDQMARAAQAIQRVRALVDMPTEPDGGTVFNNFRGGIEFRDVSFAYPGKSEPLFESTSLKLAPGSVLMVTGKNGSGKTTFARLLAGLLDPTRGQILADGVDLRQIEPRWWRTQIAYLPQEPTFLNGTIRENLTSLNPQIDDEALSKIVSRAGLAPFVNSSPKGLDAEIVGNGHALALGIRRRLALARALSGAPKLAVFDEPTEALDADGCAAVYAVMHDLSQQGATMIVFSHDPALLRGARAVLDLNSKPVPKMVVVNEGSADQAHPVRRV